LGFFPGFGGFLAGKDPRDRAAEFAAPAGPACSFVLPQEPELPKSSTKTRCSQLARALRLVIRTNVF
jgi:hypothetical protein